MGRTYKIKSYKRIYRRSMGSIVLQWVLILGALALLFFLGWKLYEPLSAMFSGEEELVQTEQEAETKQPEAETTPGEPKTEESTTPPVVEEEAKKEEPADEAETEEDPEPVALAEAALRTAYFPMSMVQNKSSFTNGIANVKAAGMDSIMIDLKSEEGWVNYPISYKEGYDDYYTAEDLISLEEVAQQIKDAGMKPIASIYTFMDRRFQQAETYAGILYEGSEDFWLDNSLEAGGKSWLNPYSPLARDYICKLIDDAADAGFTEIVLREFRFPVGAAMDQMKFVYDDGQSKLDCLKEAAELFKKHAASKGVHLWIEYPAAALTVGDSRPYGGDASQLLRDQVLIDLSAVQNDALNATLVTVQDQAAAAQAQLGILLSVGNNSDNQLQSQLLALQRAGITRYLLKY